MRTLLFVLLPLSLLSSMAGAYHVSIDWTHVTAVSKLSTTLQVVSNPLLNAATCPIANAMFESLAELKADLVRYVPWFPYPRVAVAELDPPTGLYVCDAKPDSDILNLKCGPTEGAIAKVVFAEYGNSSGFCDKVKPGSCRANPDQVRQAVEKICVGQKECRITAYFSALGVQDPCPGVQKRLSVGVLCDHPVNHTFWNFEQIRPQLEGFMNATLGHGHTAIPNFSTQPTWMYDTDDWSYPADPNAVIWNYPRGRPLASTVPLVAGYYGRLLSWLMKGGFTDEYGQYIGGGYKYDITHWEVFNEIEGEHQYTPQTYTIQYDALVEEVRRVVDPEHKINFVGLALEGRETDWMEYFLTPSNHNPAALPITYASFHFYAGCSNRTDPDSYENFFADADGFLPQLQSLLDIRDRVSPHTKLDCDETGVILPDDNDPNAPIPPNIYFNAAGAMFAYIYMNAAAMGLDVLGESQLAGSPPIPTWEIPEAQYPSVAMLNWTTGAGNARYWVLKLLIEEFQAGDKLVETSTQSNYSVMCGLVGAPNYGNITVKCADPNAVISSIDFAAFGTPTGKCGAYAIGHCNADNVLRTVEKLCVNENSCNINSYPQFGDPCLNVAKQFVVQARCTGTAGGHATPPAPEQAVPAKAQAFVTVDGKRKLLLVNPHNRPVTVSVDGIRGAQLATVDLHTENGPARREVVRGDDITLENFAVAVLTF